MFRLQVRTFVIVLATVLVTIPMDAFAQDDEAWINSFTADDAPLDSTPMHLADHSRHSDKQSGWKRAFSDVAGAMLRRGTAMRATVGARTRFDVSTSYRNGVNAGRGRIRALGVIPAGASVSSVSFRCSGGARSGNPDADISVYIYIWVEGSGVIGDARAWGYQPSAQATGSVNTAEYDRQVECGVYAGFATAFAFGVLQGACGDNARTELREEYRRAQVNWTPSCGDIADSGGSANFSWNELNGGFGTGNLHNPLGIIQSALTTGLEATRTRYNRGGITLSSGYRCPEGNLNVGGTQHSYHVKGQAADMYSASHPWTETEFNLLRDAAANTGTIELLHWNSYSDRHLHAAW